MQVVAGRPQDVATSRYKPTRARCGFVPSHVGFACNLMEATLLWSGTGYAAAASAVSEVRLGTHIPVAFALSYHVLSTQPARGDSEAQSNVSNFQSSRLATVALV